MKVKFPILNGLGFYFKSKKKRKTKIVESHLLNNAENNNENETKAIYRRYISLNREVIHC